jgi:4-hydroxy-tetrahydrodipicolinate synthase
MTSEASKLGVAGILAVCPYYNRPSQAGIEAHMKAVAAASELPMYIYDIPVRTGRKIATATLLRLAHEVPTILGVKDAAGNPGETASLIANAPEGFEVLSGDDNMTLPLLAVGAAGVIGVATHWTGHEHQELVKLWQKGDTAGARAVNARLLPSFAYETGDDAPNPIPTKVMMNVLGLAVGEARLPMGPPPEWVEGKAHEVLAGLDRAVGAR